MTCTPYTEYSLSSHIVSHGQDCFCFFWSSFHSCVIIYASLFSDRSDMSGNLAMGVFGSFISEPGLCHGFVGFTFIFARALIDIIIPQPLTIALSQLHA